MMKSGYKHTEVGVIPEDWEVLHLSALCSEIVDGTHHTPKYVDVGIPFYSVENVTANDFENTKFISQEEHQRLTKRCKPEKGDLLLTRIGSLGITKLIDWDVEASIYVSLALLRPNNRADASYLYAYSKSKQFLQDVEKRSLTNATPQKINMGDIGNLPIPVPKRIGEQRAIAEVLGEVDELLAALERLIAKKRDVKTAVMQQLLTGERRLPGFTGRWNRKQLGEIAGVTMGQSPSSLFYNTKGVGLPLIQGNADISNRKTIIRNYTTQITKRCFRGDIILSVRAPVGEVAKAEFDACIGRGVCAISYPNEFLYHCLIFLEPNWGKLAKGSTFDSVNSDEVKALEIHIPDEIKEQQAIATVLSDMDAEIAALEARHAKIQAIKQGMMQELLTGRTRLV